MRNGQQHNRTGSNAGSLISTPKVGSWAAIAATPTPKSNIVVKHHQEEESKRTFGFRLGNQPVKKHEMRVVWVLPFDMSQNLSAVTKEIHEGPLLSVAYSQADRAVCIIFQHSDHARAFLFRNQEYQDKKGQSLYGPDVRLLEGQAYPYDAPLRRMDAPTNERRRLTFARSKLFCPGEGGVSEHVFEKHIYELVGIENVELVWLFNTGNGTHTFTCMDCWRLIGCQRPLCSQRPASLELCAINSESTRRQKKTLTRSSKYHSHTTPARGHST